MNRHFLYKSQYGLLDSARHSMTSASGPNPCTDGRQPTCPPGVRDLPHRQCTAIMTTIRGPNPCTDGHQPIYRPGDRNLPHRQGIATPVGKRSSLRKKSYEVVPAPGGKVYLSDDIPVPVRPPPLSDQDAAVLVSRSQVRSDPATGTSPLISNPLQPPPEVASDSVQPPPEVAPDSMESIDLSWQIATSRRSARTLRHLAPVISRTVVMHDDVIINPPPASAATFSTSAIDASTPASASTFSVSTVQAPTSVECPSVGLPTSVADSTSVLSNSSSELGQEYHQIDKLYDPEPYYFIGFISQRATFPNWQRLF